MKNINWKRKLTSRKLWTAVASFVSMMIVATGGAENTATQVTARPEHLSWRTSSEKDSPTPQTLDPMIQRNKKRKAPRAATRLPFFI